MDELTGFQRDLLYVIAGLSGPSGLEIITDLSEYYSKEIPDGRLYPNLDTLIEMELIEKGRRDNRTNKYQLTDRGKREIKARRNWEDRYVTFHE